MSYARSITTDLPYHEAVPRVKEAFQTQGFGTLTEIDVRDTLEKKLDERIEDYVILGVCNPQLAHRALQVDRHIGLLLPCTVVVRAGDRGTIIEALDPQTMVEVTGEEELRQVADEASERIGAALDELAA